MVKVAKSISLSSQTIHKWKRNKTRKLTHLRINVLWMEKVLFVLTRAWTSIWTLVSRITNALQNVITGCAFCVRMIWAFCATGCRGVIGLVVIQRTLCIKMTHITDRKLLKPICNGAMLKESSVWLTNYLCTLDWILHQSKPHFRYRWVEPDHPDRNLDHIVPAQCVGRWNLCRQFHHFRDCQAPHSPQLNENFNMLKCSSYTER